MTAKSFSSVLGRQLRTSAGKAESRGKLIGAVRAAASRMRLSDDDRRAIQLEVTGKRSLADMTLGEIGKVLDRLNRDRPAPMGHRAHAAKIKALWWSCYWLGAIDEPNDVALDAFVRRQTGLSSLRFVDHRKAPALIEALKAIAGREGVTWRTDAQVAEINERHRAAGDLPILHADREAVLLAIWEKLREARLVGGYADRIGPYVSAALKLGETDLRRWTPHEFDAAIKLLGKRLRRHLAKPTPDP